MDVGEQLEAPSAPVDDGWLSELEAIHQAELASAEAFEQRRKLDDVSVAEALARQRAKWAHPPVDKADVEERLALRLIDHPELEVRVTGPYRGCPACRVFVRHPRGWRSRYVHSVAEVDAALEWCGS